MHAGTPTIINNINDKELSIVSGGEELVLTCKFIGDDISAVYWERLNDGQLSSKINRTVVSNGNVVLTISEARPNYSGLYRCMVYSPWGITQSRDVHVTITGKCSIDLIKLN